MPGPRPGAAAAAATAARRRAPGVVGGLRCRLERLAGGAGARCEQALDTLHYETLEVLDVLEVDCMGSLPLGGGGAGGEEADSQLDHANFSGSEAEELDRLMMTTQPAEV